MFCGECCGALQCCDADKMNTKCKVVPILKLSSKNLHCRNLQSSKHTGGIYNFLENLNFKFLNPTRIHEFEKVADAAALHWRGAGRAGGEGREGEGRKGGLKQRRNS